ncbi:MAG: hypothetical protein AAGA81_03885 [Acidobacteriota bacterium]
MDKRLSGIQAVQTLSRLNRMRRGKEATFVLDFVNDREGILESFQDYYESTTTDEPVDPQRLYELQHELTEWRVWTESEVDGFAGVLFKLPHGGKVEDHAELNAFLDPAVDRFKALGDDGEDRKEKQEALRGQLVAFRNLYSFLGQVVPFQDPGLEKLYAFARLLLRKLPRPEGEERWDPGDDVVLASLKLQKAAEGDLYLQSGSEGMLTGPHQAGMQVAEPVREKLSTIIDTLNNRFGLNLPDHVEKVLDGVIDEMSASETMRQAASVNDEGNFRVIFDPAFSEALVDHHSENGDFVDLVFRDQALREALNKLVSERVYSRAREDVAK